MTTQDSRESTEPSGWRKLPAIESFTCCNVCGPKPQAIPLDAQPHPGFGEACLMRDGVGGGPDHLAREDFTVQDCEDVAAADPDHDWRLVIRAPLYEAVYQRQGDSLWVLVERGDGFA